MRRALWMHRLLGAIGPICLHYLTPSRVVSYLRSGTSNLPKTVVPPELPTAGTQHLLTSLHEHFHQDDSADLRHRGCSGFGGCRWLFGPKCLFVVDHDLKFDI